MPESHADRYLEGLRKPIEKAFNEGVQELGLEGKAVFGGYEYWDSNGRAATQVDTIFYNGKYLSIPEQEKQRVMFHELQHVQNHTVWELAERQYETWAFVFHPMFEDLHRRMKAHYLGHKEKGYPFGKKLWEISSDYEEEFLRQGLTYTHYDEVLALLRGYEKALKQLELGVTVKSEPYEFFEAFQPDDLKLLDPEFRAALAAEVVKEKPELIPAHLLEK